ncbi:hypothetical protein [Archangium sp.]|uniref:hypothetical protein n=1 Tax=Archangium sp. TaxID=1872627 RepID=UPI00286B69EB|nr:hypothetical protein [Archangium sp.]
MSAPEDEQKPLWPPLVLTLGVLFIATETRNPTLALTALCALVLLPTAWRLMTRRWVRGDVLRGLAAGYLASHVPLLLGACSTLNRPECRIRLCLDGVLAAVPFIPWAGLLGSLLYWAWAAPPPDPRDR